MTSAMNNSTLRTHGTDTHHGGDLRPVLGQAALELAAEDKDWNFSLREVARSVGVSHNAPYSHFPHKRDLLEAAAATDHDLLLRSELTPAVAKIADPCAALSKMSSAYVSFGIKDLAPYRLMLASDDLANVEHRSMERIAQKLVTTTLRGLAGSGASTIGSTI